MTKNFGRFFFGKKLVEKNFGRKKNDRENFGRKTFLVRKKLVEKMLVDFFWWLKKKSTKLFFDLFFDQKKSTNFFRSFFFDHFFDLLFSMKKNRSTFFGYLFRSQISPRFQKSHLENHAMSFENPGYNIIPKSYKKTLQVGKIPGNPYRTLWMDSQEVQ